LIVDPGYRHTGIGTSLHASALEYLETKVKESFKYASPPPEKSSIQLGSTFPRIFPGIPEGPGFDEAKAWLERRGWKFGDKKSIDLYQPLKAGRRTDLEASMQKAKAGGFTFGEPRAEDVGKLYQLQRDNFDSYTVSRLPDAILRGRGLLLM
jgi:beta-N-acetylhexosaminidase